MTRNPALYQRATAYGDTFHARAQILVGLANGLADVAINDIDAIAAMRRIRDYVAEMTVEQDDALTAANRRRG